MKTLIMLLCVFALSGCGFFSKKPSEDKNPLLSTECPVELPALNSDTFGAADLKLIEVAGIYHACRKAAISGTK